MRFFVHALGYELRALLRERLTLALVLLLPLVILVLGRLVPVEESPAVTVGWVIPEGSARGEELLELLQQDGDGLVDFVETDESTLRRNVAAGKWACGFILRPDFDSRVERQSWSKLFTAVYAEGDVLHSLVSEDVSAALLTMVSGEISTAYLEARGVPAPEGGWSLPGARRLLIQPAQDGQLGIAPVMRGLGENLLRGAAAIVLTLLCLSMGDALARRRRTEVYRRLAAVRGEGLPLLAALLVRYALLFLAAFLSLAAAGAAEAGPLAALCLSLMALTGFLAMLPAGWSAPALPFVPWVLLVLCPILFDASGLFPALGALHMPIPAAHYLHGAIAPLLALTGFYGLCAWLACRFSK
jgi:hypothetical protein